MDRYPGVRDARGKKERGAGNSETSKHPKSKGFEGARIQGFAGEGSGESSVAEQSHFVASARPGTGLVGFRGLVCKALRTTMWL